MIEALVVHQIPSRIRIKVPSKKGDIPFFENVMNSLEKINVIEKIEINALTGSIIIFSSSNTEALIQSIKSLGLFNLVCPSYSEKRTMHNSIEYVVRQIDKGLKDITSGELNLADTVFLVLVAVAIYQIQRGNFMAPAWYTAIWYAINMFSKSEDKK